MNPEACAAALAAAPQRVRGERKEHGMLRPTVEGCGGWGMYGAQEAKLSENVGTEPTELEIA